MFYQIINESIRNITLNLDAQAKIVVLIVYSLLIFIAFLVREYCTTARKFYAHVVCNFLAWNIIAFKASYIAHHFTTFSASQVNNDFIKFRIQRYQGCLSKVFRVFFIDLSKMFRMIYTEPLFALLLNLLCAINAVLRGQTAYLTVNHLNWYTLLLCHCKRGLRLLKFFINLSVILFIGIILASFLSFFTFASLILILIFQSHLELMLCQTCTLAFFSITIRIIIRCYPLFSILNGRNLFFIFSIFF